MEGRMQVEAPAMLTEEDVIARIAGLPDLVDADPGLIRCGRFLDASVLVAAGDRSVILDIRAGRVVAVVPGPGLMRSWTFAVRGTVRAWDGYWQAVPAPGWHDLFALSKRGEMIFEGALQPFVANLQYVKDLLALPRRAGCDARGGGA